MRRNLWKLFAMAFFSGFIGVFFLSNHATYADSENKSDILKRLKNYRSWKQIKKSENPTPLTIGPITLDAFEIAASSTAG